MEDPDPLPYYLATLAADSETLFLLGGILFFILCSAVVSASEVAFFSLTPLQQKDFRGKKGTINETITFLLKRPDYLLATILIINNVVNICIVLVSTRLLKKIDFGEQEMFGIVIDFNTVVEVGVITFVLLLFGEIIPKVYANSNSTTMVKRVAVPIRLSYYLVWPFSFVLVNFTRIIDRKIKPENKSITAEELQHVLEISEEAGNTESEKKILKEITTFGNKEAVQVMTSRVDVVALDITLKFSEVVEKVLDAGFSRLPVYEDQYDQIKGVLYIKDLLPYLDEGEDFEWQKLIRSPFFVPENKKLDDLLSEFQEKKVHIAIVVDEYGGVCGVVTFEDVIEEIVGEISDEFDDEGLTYSVLDEQNILFEGKILLNDLYRVLGIEGMEFEEKKGESETLAGFILEISGRIPEIGEEINFDDYILKIEDADRRRIKSVKLTSKQPVNK